MAPTIINGNPVDSKDPWALSQSGYSKDQIYTRSTDGHGHGETLYIKLSTGVMGEIGNAVRAVAGYRSAADFVRDAVLHRLHDVAEWEPDHINLAPIKTEMRLNELLRAADNERQWDELIATLDARLAKYIHDGDVESARYFMEQNADVDEEMAPPYQQKVTGVFRRHMADLEMLEGRDR